MTSTQMTVQKIWMVFLFFLWNSIRCSNIDIMLDVVQKRKIRNVAYNRVTLIVLVIITLFFLHSTWNVYQKKSESEQAMKVSAQNLATLEARDADLQAKMQSLQTDAGIEAEIRSKFNVAKAGENIVVVVDNTATTTPPSEPSGFWAKLKDLFVRH